MKAVGRGVDRAGIGFATCFALVVANMIGTGVFTSLGFQLEEIRRPLSVMLLWLLGGVFSFCGALCYAELAGALPRSGGEYHFLSKVYHPSLGVMAGVVSVVAGFSAPTALAAMAFGKYLAAAQPGISPLAASLALAAMVTGFHLVNLGVSSGFQNFFTTWKVLLVAGLALAGFLHAPAQELDWGMSREVVREIGRPGFAISLMFVLYSFSGWNAAAYVAGETREPARDAGRALLWGTAVVCALYLALNAAFLLVAPAGEMRGQLDVARIFAEHLFGRTGGKVIAGLICIGLVSAVSAMMWAGPRVTMVMGEDWGVFRWAARKNRGGIPVAAVLLQFGIVVALILSGSFAAVLVYTQFALVACSAMTVLGVLVLRRRQPGIARPFRCPAYPLPPLLFLAISLFAMGYTLAHRPVEALGGLGTLLAGLGIYFLVRPKLRAPFPS